jgi:hypothetical protein
MGDVVPFPRRHGNEHRQLTNIKAVRALARARRFWSMAKSAVDAEARRYLLARASELASEAMRRQRAHGSHAAEILRIGPPSRDLN